MIQRQTQNIAYWREKYKVDEADHEFLYEFLADANKPQSVETLAHEIISRRCAQEEARIRNELSRGLIFDPKESYDVDDDVVFPTFDFRMAKVISVRTGDNPEHGEFDVIRVRFGDNGKEKLFAAHLQSPHRLNRTDDGELFATAGLLSVEELVDEAGTAVAATVARHLQDQPDYFINAGRLWLTTDQMVAVNVGHLNIAEAAIEVNGVPMTTPQLLEMVELDEGAAEAVRAFSLETALGHDQRFVQIGVDDTAAWYLQRLIPEAALEVPTLLQHVPEPYERSLLDVELLQTEWELNDELTDGGLAEDTSPGVKSASVYLIFPHWAAGTLPLPRTTRSLFPGRAGKTSRVTFVDGRWGKRFDAWVVHEGGYVAGLGEWYKDHKLPVGARINLERSQTDGEIVIDYRPVRARRDWIRMVRVESHRLVFQMTRQQMICEYDDHLAIGFTDLDSILALGEQVRSEGVTVKALVEQIMPELVKLSPQGTVHVKTLYSAVNLLRRTVPAPIFAALTQLPTATDTGSGYWNL